ncbi:hypothetical protein KR067_004090 [Drosophila pandora]|nr:hypothetical protein KR067_004090 [Drosophila pandora]
MDKEGKEGQQGEKPPHPPRPPPPTLPRGTAGGSKSPRKPPPTPPARRVIRGTDVENSEEAEKPAARQVARATSPLSAAPIHKPPPPKKDGDGSPRGKSASSRLVIRDRSASATGLVIDIATSPQTQRHVRDFGASPSPRPPFQTVARSTSPLPTAATQSPQPIKKVIASTAVGKESPRPSGQEAVPSTSAQVTFAGVTKSSGFNIFGKKKPKEPPKSTATGTRSASLQSGGDRSDKKAQDRRTSERRGPERTGQERRSGVGPSGVQNKTKATRILYTTDEEVRDALMEFAVFIIFLVLTSLVTLSVRHSYMFYFNDTMKRLFTTRELVVAPSVTISFEKLITVPDWWDYLVYNFLVTLHGDMTVTKPAEPPPPSPPPQPPPPPPPPPEKLREMPPKVPDDEILDEDWDQLRDYRRKIRQEESPEAGEGDSESSEDKITEPNFVVPSHHLTGRVFLHENLLLGPPRIRQIRVKKDSCYVNDAFIRYFNTCYAAYSSGTEERTKNYKGSPYRSMNDLDSTPIWTVLAFYRSGGYVMDLTFEKDDNLKIITDLKNTHWLDRGSRLCLIEFNLYNENTDIFQSVKFIAEIPPTGGVIPQAQLQTVKLFSFFTERSLLMTVIYIFWYIMIVYYTIYEINELRKSGSKNYFSSMLNVLDCLILLLCYLALVYNIWHTFKVKSVTHKATTQLTYQSLDVLCFWNIIYVDMMAILAFLVWIKIFKFISFNKTLVQFTTTLKRCSKDLAGFSLMFGIVFLAYAQLGLLLFGTKHPDFRNFITSILTMIRMILGDFQYNLIEQANRVLGPIYFLTYILLVFFILLNMFLAIIMETYNSVKSEITQGRSHLGSYIYKKLTGLLYWITHCGRKRRARAQGTPEEELDHNRETEATNEEPYELRSNMTQAQ